MATNPFRAFTAYDIPQKLYEAILDLTDEDPGEFMAVDPDPFSWSAIGMRATSTEGLYVHNLDGTGVVFAIQVAKRMLPGRVIREKVDKEATLIVEREARKPSRTEYAELREAAESDLLPKAFINRKFIPVMFTGSRMLIFSTSAKVCDDILTFMSVYFAERGLVDSGIDAKFYAPSNTPRVVLTAIAKEHLGSGTFDALDYAMLANPNEDQQTIRVKGRSLLSGDVQELLNAGYQVTELALSYLDEEGDEIITFKMNERFVVKGIKGVAMKNIDADEDFHALAYLAAVTFTCLLADLSSTIGGLEDDDDDL